MAEPRDGTPSEPPLPPRRLDGWKEIAAYLNRSVRTVQRWEKEAGLPVRRLRSQGGEVVFALAEDLEQWLQATPEGRANETATSEEEREKALADRDERPPELPSGVSRRKFPSAWIGVAGLVVTSALIVAVVAWMPNPGGGTRARTPPVRRAGEPGIAVIDGELMSFGSAGRLIWSKPFEPVALATDPAVVEQQLAVDDVDGDGNDEVLVVPADETPDGPLYCFNADGTLRFAFHVNRTVAFRETKNNDDPIPPVTRRYGRPFRFSRLFVAPDPQGRKTIWATAHHQPYYPSVLLEMRLTATGEPQVVAEYWSPGAITAAAVGRMSGRYTVLVGAAHNETRGGSLAVFLDRLAQGGLPSLAGDKQCVDCPPGRPDVLFLFPRSPLLAAVNANAATANIQTPSDAGFTVSVTNGNGSVTGSHSYSHYTFDGSFRIIDAQVDQGYPVLLGRLQQADVVPRDFPPYKEADLFPVVKWNGTTYDKVNGPERKP